MRKTVVISAKIREKYAELIRAGIKRYEIRIEPFDDAQAIRYVGAKDGEELGLYRINASYSINRDEEERLMAMSAISAKEFHQLFPPIDQGGPGTLWVAEIGEPVTMEQLLKGAMA